MPEIFSLGTINEEVPDDVFIAASSFEERCVGAARIMSSAYKARLCFIAHLMSSTSEVGQARRKRFTEELFERLSWVDEVDQPWLEVVPAHDFQSLWNGLERALSSRQIDFDRSRLTIDISCFTRIDLVLLMRQLLRRCGELCKMRLVYSTPSEYVTELQRRSDLVYGHYELVTIPYETKAVVTPSPATVRRVCFVGIGHEGDRVLNIWRALEPDMTYVLYAHTSSDRADRMTEKRNASLLGKAEQGDPAFELLRVDHGKLDELALLIDECYQRERSKGPLEVSFIPFGAKPVSVIFSEWALCREGQMVNIGYSIPQSYNGHYSRGVSRVFSRFSGDVKKKLGKRLGPPS